MHNSHRFKYINRNAFPLYLPDPYGSKRLFVPGEWDDSAWWSKFTRPAQLTAEPLIDTDKKLKREGMKLVKKSRRAFIEIPPWGRPQNNHSSSTIPHNSACSNSCMIACESSTQDVANSADWLQIGNDFFCKVCCWSTTDKQFMESHITAYHRKHSC
jgi:hypothetical protein